METNSRVAYFAIASWHFGVFDTFSVREEYKHRRTSSCVSNRTGFATMWFWQKSLNFLIFKMFIHLFAKLSYNLCMYVRLDVKWCSVSMITKNHLANKRPFLRVGSQGPPGKLRTLWKTCHILIAANAVNWL